MERAEVSASAPTVRRLGLAAWVLALITVAVGGDALLTGPLAPPALTDPGSWAGWAGARTPVDAAFAVLGLTLVVVAWYLLAVTAVQAAATVVGASRLISIADLLTLPAVKRSVHAVLGAGLACSVVAAGAARGSNPFAGAPMGLVAASAPLEGEPPAELDTPVMRRLPDGAPEEPAAVRGSAAVPAAGEWTVAPGEHLWSVAASVLEAAWEAPADETQVASYWRRLIDANTDRLADPANPDLVFPGQRLSVVEPPPAPR